MFILKFDYKNPSDIPLLKEYYSLVDENDFPEDYPGDMFSNICRYHYIAIDFSNSKILGRLLFKPSIIENKLNYHIYNISTINWNNKYKDSYKNIGTSLIKEMVNDIKNIHNINSFLHNNLNIDIKNSFKYSHFNFINDNSSQSIIIFLFPDYKTKKFYKKLGFIKTSFVSTMYYSILIN